MAERMTIQTQGYIPTPADHAAWTPIAQSHKPDAFGSHDQLPQVQLIPQFVQEQARMFDAVIAERYRRWASREICAQDIIEGRSTMQYDGEFDIGNYQGVFAIEDKQARERALAQLDDYTRRQLVAHLGERVNVLLSTIDYSITQQGQLYVPQLGKTAGQMVIDGRDHQFSLPDVREIDKPRMNAEIDEMRQVEALLCDLQTPVGTMITVISAPGREEKYIRQTHDGKKEATRDSMFLHNFYDVFRLEEREVEGRKERYVRLYRYSSSLTYEEYLHMAIQLKRDYFASAEAQQTSLDAYFLSHLLDLTDSGFEDPENVHKFFHRDHTYMARRDFEEVLIPGTSELVERYIAIMHKLATLPAEELRSEQAHTFNVLLIEADKLQESIVSIQNATLDNLQVVREQLVLKTQTTIASYTLKDILILGRQENVTQKAGDCPGKSGMNTGGGGIESIATAKQAFIALNTSPFSVGDQSTLDSDLFGPREFHCPACKQINRRPFNGYITLCQNEKCPDRSAVACKPK